MEQLVVRKSITTHISPHLLPTLSKFAPNCPSPPAPAICWLSHHLNTLSSEPACRISAPTACAGLETSNLSIYMMLARNIKHRWPAKLIYNIKCPICTCEKFSSVWRRLINYSSETVNVKACLHGNKLSWYAEIWNWNPRTALIGLKIDAY